MVSLILFLLIEPVWNRNIYPVRQSSVSRVSPSNRTSMESKQFMRLGRVAIVAPLLIEPVWNRN